MHNSRSPLLLLTVLVAPLVVVEAQQDRINLRTKMCAPITLQDCYRVAQNCLDLSLSMREDFSDQTNAVACASEEGINFFTLWWASSSDKTNKEVLADAGANPEQAKRITRCVLTARGYARNNVLDVNKVKNNIRPIINRDITNQVQKQATLAAVDSCAPPTVDTMRPYVLCITKTCIHNRG